MASWLCHACFRAVPDGDPRCPACQTAVVDRTPILAELDAGSLERKLLSAFWAGDWPRVAVAASQYLASVLDVAEGIRVAATIRSGPKHPARRARLAHAFYARLLELDPISNRLMILRAEALLASGEAEEARAPLRAVHLAQPDAEVCSLLARAELGSGNADAAARYALEALLRDPIDSDAAGEVLLQAAESSPTLTELEKFIAGFEASPDRKVLAILRLAEAALRAKQTALVRRWVDSIPASTRPVPLWERLLAETLALEGKNEDALRTMEGLSERYPGDLGILAAMVRIMRSSKSYDEALKWLEKLEKMAAEEDRWRWSLEKAQIFREKKEYAAARSLLEELAEREPASLEIAGVLMAVLGFDMTPIDYPKIRKYAEAFLAASGMRLEEVRDHPLRYRHLANPLGDFAGAHGFGQLELPGRLPPARVAFEAALALWPKWANAWFGMGRTEREGGNLEEAIRCFQNAVDLDSKFRNARYQLARTLFQAGKKEQAERVLAQGLVDLPNDALYKELKETFAKVEPPPSTPTDAPLPPAHKGKLHPIANLPDFVHDLTLMADRGDLHDILDREREMEEMIEILCRHEKGNPIILGEAGTGKTALVAGLAHRILRNEVPKSLEGFRVLEVRTTGVRHDQGLAGTFEEKVDRLGKLWEKGGILLFVDEFHVIIGAGSTRSQPAGGFDQLLKPFLTRPGLHMIAATTRAEYEQHILGDAALDRRFSPVQVNPPDRKLTAAMCRLHRDRWQKRYEIALSDARIDEGVALSEEALPLRHFPDRAIEVLERACVKAMLRTQKKKKGKKEVTREDLEAAAEAAKAQARVPDFVRDLTELARDGRLQDVVGREAEIQELIEILCRQEKGNPVILGEAGTGKTTLVHGLAHRLSRGEVPAPLKDLRLFEVLHAGLHADTKWIGTLETKVQQLTRLWEQGGAILFLDEIHTIVGAGASSTHRSGGLDQLLKPLLTRPGLRLIGATTESEWARSIPGDPALERRLTPIVLRTPDAKHAAAVCRARSAKWGEAYGVKIEDAAIEKAVFLADRYLPNRNFPDKAIDLLERGCVKAMLRSSKSVETADLVGVVASLARLDPSQVRAEAQGEGIDLERDLRKIMVGQEEAIRAVARVIEPARAFLDAKPQRPDGAFLIVGPPGSGKKKLCKTLATVLGGSKAEPVMIYLPELRLDDLLGTPYSGGGGEPGILERSVRENPASVFVLVEWPDAHPALQEVLIRLIRDGSIGGRWGQRIDVSRAVFAILSEFVPSGGPASLGFRKEDLAPKQELDRALRERFSAELLRVVDRIVVLRPLSSAELEELTRRKLAEAVARLEDRGVRVEVAPEVIAHLASRLREEEEGARMLRTLLDDCLTRPIARALASKPSGQRFRARIREGEVVVEAATGGPD